MPNKLLKKISVPIILIILAVFPFLAKAEIVINEVAWMGISGTNGQYGEWIEFYNSSDQEINLVDWKLYRNGGLLESDRIFTLTKSIQSKGYFVIERTTNSIPDPLPNVNDEIGAFGGGNLANRPGGEFLVLKDNNDNIIQSLDFSGGWPEGDNISKKTMQKILSGWTTATGTPKAVNVEQSESQSSSPSSQTSSSASNSSSQNSSSLSLVANSGGGSVSWPDEQQIYANAGKDKTGIAGADVLFEGKALGIKKEPLENARYLWNFGDGSSGEGKNIKHIYKYPENYIVVLDVSSGQYSVSDKTNVKITPNELIISEASDEFIKLKNKSGTILDISGWFLAGGGVSFKFPGSSFISANSDLIISSDISKIKFSGNNAIVNLLYPNDSVAFSYLPSSASSLSASSKPKEIILSKPTEKKAEIATAQFISKKNSSNSSSNSSASSADKSQNFTAGKNLASVITIGEKNNHGNKIWLILAVITGILGGAGVFLARRNNQTLKN